MKNDNKPPLFTTKKHKTNLQLLLILGLLLFILILFIFSVVILFFIYTLDFNTEEDSTELSRYHFQEISPLSNLTEHGFVKMKKTLNSEEYVTYSQESKTILILPFEGEEYTCSGGCYCTDEYEEPYKITENRKSVVSSNNILLTGFFLIVTAFSTYQATKIAEESFRTACFSKFDDDDDCLGEIIPLIQGCDGKTAEDMFLEGFEEFQAGGPDEIEKRVQLSFKCEGFCLFNKRVFFDEAKIAIEKKWGKEKCNNLEIDGYVEVECDDSQMQYSCQILAKEEFRKIYLNQFCRAYSQVQFRTQGLPGVDKNAFETYNVPACTGMNEFGGWVENVRCLRMEKPENK